MSVTVFVHVFDHDHHTILFVFLFIKYLSSNHRKSSVYLFIKRESFCCVCPRQEKVPVIITQASLFGTSIPVGRKSFSDVFLCASSSHHPHTDRQCWPHKNVLTEKVPKNVTLYNWYLDAVCGCCDCDPCLHTCQISVYNSVYSLGRYKNSYCKSRLLLLRSVTRRTSGEPATQHDAKSNKHVISQKHIWQHEQFHLEHGAASCVKSRWAVYTWPQSCLVCDI